MKYDVITFAKQELETYLKKLGITAKIELGLLGDFSLSMDVEDPNLDDGYIISVHNLKGYIAGTNERSVLFGVYRLLEEWGITWVRPGPNGTHFPENPNSPDLNINEKAALRHRTMCIEGAISYENVLDMIDYMTKVGFNGYFIQFEDALTFFQRWYKHLNNPYKEGKALTQEEINDFMKILVGEIKKRGLMLHRKGHGWHNLAFGMSEDPAFQPKPEEVPKEYVDLCAEINGKRELYKNNPFLTQLCYSNPKVIIALADAVADYAEKNPETDYIHYWLSDEVNNTCECSECIKKTCSDHYVNIINQITDRFVERGIKAKLVPLIYLDAIYAPTTEKFRNLECITFGFAPITRTFADAFPETFRRTDAPKYELNNFKKPLDIDENLSHLYAWQQLFKGEYVDFDYHLMWDFMLDAGGERMAKVIHTDLSHFDGLGLCGYISCQLQRNALPTSIGMTVMAKTMWHGKTDFDEIRYKLYNDAFGRGTAQKLCDYFALLSDKFDFGIIKEEKECTDIEAFKNEMIEAVKTMDDFAPVIKENLIKYDPCERYSWELLEHHRILYTKIAKVLIARIENRVEEGDKIMQEAFQYAFQNEDFLKPVFDCFFFRQTITYRLRLAKKGLDEIILR